MRQSQTNYVASFTLNGVEYKVEAQRLELEEVIKITASIINMPYSENFVVGLPQDIPDKGSPPLNTLTPSLSQALTWMNPMNLTRHRCALSPVSPPQILTFYPICR